jgi:hypothetical protein
VSILATTLAVSITSLVTAEDGAGIGSKAATVLGNSIKVRDIVIHLENKPRPTSRWQGDMKWHSALHKFRCELGTPSCEPGV